MTHSGLPANYDAWRLSGPDEDRDPDMTECEACNGTGKMHDDDGEFDCDECCGAGEVAVTPEEPDSDYLYERARDRRMEDI